MKDARVSAKRPGVQDSAGEKHDYQAGPQARPAWVDWLCSWGDCSSGKPDNGPMATWMATDSMACLRKRC